MSPPAQLQAPNYQPSCLAPPLLRNAIGANSAAAMVPAGSLPSVCAGRQAWHGMVRATYKSYLAVATRQQSNST